MIRSFGNLGISFDFQVKRLIITALYMNLDSKKKVQARDGNSRPVNSILNSKIKIKSGTL